jgi:predicted alpha/beta-hydrolase family hydrolase
VIRYDLPFRQERPHGPPRPGDAARDREGLREQVLKARERKAERVWLGGHSYGGRQASMLAAEAPGLADALLLLSYPLHPPRKPDQPRTAHFPKLETPALFVHGSRDPFGSLEELKQALSLIPATMRLLEIEGAGHELGRNPAATAAKIIAEFDL